MFVYSICRIIFIIFYQLCPNPVGINECKIWEIYWSKGVGTPKIRPFIYLAECCFMLEEARFDLEPQ